MSSVTQDCFSTRNTCISLNEYTSNWLFQNAIQQLLTRGVHWTWNNPGNEPSFNANQESVTNGRAQTHCDLISVHGEAILKVCNGVRLNELIKTHTDLSLWINHLKNVTEKTNELVSET